jgi:transcriptional regulator with XRE-family HTH domain
VRRGRSNRKRESEGVLLGDLRQRYAASQQQVADVLGTTQPGVLKIERSSDPQLSSIRRYVQALGRQVGRDATLEVTAVLGSDRVALRFPPPEEPDRAAPDTSPSGARTCWRLRVWNDAELERRFLTENLIAISDDEIGDLTDWPSDVELRRRLRAVEAFANKTEQAIGLFASYWSAFRSEMQSDDVVVVPLSQRRAAIGLIEGPYRYRSQEADSKMRHVREVRWLRVIPRSELDEEIRKVVNAPGTICRIQAPGAARNLVPPVGLGQAAS